MPRFQNQLWVAIALTCAATACMHRSGAREIVTISGVLLNGSPGAVEAPLAGYAVAVTASARGVCPTPLAAAITDSTGHFHLAVARAAVEGEWMFCFGQTQSGPPRYPAYFGSGYTDSINLACLFHGERGAPECKVEPIVRPT